MCWLRRALLNGSASQWAPAVSSWGLRTDSAARQILSHFKISPRPVSAEGDRCRSDHVLVLVLQRDRSEFARGRDFVNSSRVPTENRSPRPDVVAIDSVSDLNPTPRALYERSDRSHKFWNPIPRRLVLRARQTMLAGRPRLCCHPCAPPNDDHPHIASIWHETLQKVGFGHSVSSHLLT